MADRKDEAALPSSAPYAAVFLGVASAKTLARKGESRPLDAFKLAERLAKKRAPERAIYEQTNKLLEGTPYAGISYDVEGKPRFEVSDRGATMKGFGGKSSVPMMDFLDHPELYKALPSAATKVRIQPDPTLGKASGSFDGKTVRLGPKHFAPGQTTFTPMGTATARGTVLHEVQHVGQVAHDRQAGSSPDQFRKQVPGKSLDAQIKRHALYERVGGEVEAEVTRLSARMTPEQRRAEHPDDRLARMGLPPRSEHIRVKSDGTMAMAEKPTKAEADITDFGERIGGARKDRAVKRGSRASGEAPAEKVPGWQKQFAALELRGGGWAVANIRGKFPKIVSGGHRYATEAEAKAAVPLAAVSQNHRVTGLRVAEGESPQYGIVRKTPKGYVPAAGDMKFATRDEAMKHMATNAAQLLGERTPQGYTEALLRAAKVTHTDRVGPAMRSGDISPDQFMKTFGPRGVEFGHWEEGIRRQKLLNEAHDAMHDLARATGLKPNQVTLGGQLGVSFGARGNGGLKSASATYHPDYGTMNLTKPAGAGALAHEWMHALDHAMARVDDPVTLNHKVTNALGDQVWRTIGDLNFASERVTNSPRNAQLNAEVRQAYRDLMDTMTKRQVSNVEPVDALQRAADYGNKNLERNIASMRDELAREVTYRQRGNKAATPEQLARFDEIAGKLKAGEFAAPEWKFAGDENARLGSRGSMTHRYVSPELDALSAVMKEVRGRTGFDSTNRSGPLDRIANDLVGAAKINERLANAKAGIGVERTEATDFLKNARVLDQTRSSPYWTQRLEMFARAGEAFVHDKLAAQKQASPYLVGGTVNSFEAASAALKGGIEGEPKPYPEGAERAAINQKFERLFETINKHGMLPEAANTDNFKAPTPTAAPAVERAAVVAEAMKGTGERIGWSDAARAASAEARGVELGHNTPPAEAKAATAVDKHAAATDAYNEAMRKGSYTEIQAREAEMRQSFDALKATQTGTGAEKPAHARATLNYTHLDKLTDQELTSIQRQIMEDPASRNPEHTNGKSIRIYNKKAEAKLDTIAREITYRLGQKAKAKEAAPVEAPKPAANVHQGTLEQSAAVKAAKANDVKGLAAALGTNTTRASDALKRYRSGKMTDAHLNALMPKPKAPPMQMAAKPAAPSSKLMAALSEDTPHVQMAKAGKLPASEVRWMAEQVNSLAKEPKGSLGRRAGSMAFQDLVKVTGSDRAARSAMREASGRSLKPAVTAVPVPAAVAPAPAEAAPAPKAKRTRAPKAAKAPTSGLIGFQNESTLNAALDAQGKAEAGKAEKVKKARKPRAPKAPKVEAPAAAAAPAAPKFDASAIKPVAINDQLIDTHTAMKAAPKPSVMGAISKGIEKAAPALNKLNAVGMIAAPAAAGAVAFDETRERTGSTAKAAGAAAVAGGVTAAVMVGIGKGISGAFNVAAKVAPKIAPALGPVGVALGAGMMAYGAYQGAKTHGWKGAVLGSIGAEGVLDIGKTPNATWAAQPEAAGPMSTADAHKFEAANTAHQGMQAAKAAAETGAIEVSEFTRTRRTESGTTVVEKVKAFQRARPGQGKQR